MERILVWRRIERTFSPARLHELIATGWGSEVLKPCEMRQHRIESVRERENFEEMVELSKQQNLN